MNDKLELVEKEYNKQFELLNKQKVENEIINSQVNSAVLDRDNKINELSVARQALEFIESVAIQRRDIVKEKIEAVVGEGLRLIYGGEYSIAMNYSIKYNRSDLDIKLKREIDGRQIIRNMNGFGGGVSDVISVPLRLLMIGCYPTAPICILDECYKHLDLSDRIERAGQFLCKIAREMGIQIILLSHHNTMQEFADVVWHIVDVNGHAEIRKEKR